MYRFASCLQCDRCLQRQELLQRFWLEIRLNTLSLIKHFKEIIHHHYCLKDIRIRVFSDSYFTMKEQNQITIEGCSLRKKSLYLHFFWSVFSHIWTEYGNLQSKSPYSVRMRENADQKDSE